MPLRVGLVDDSQRFRERLRALLTRYPDIEIVLEARSAHELLALAPAIAMDVVCMDIRLPGMSGIDATRRLLAIQPAVRIIGLSAYAEPHYVEAMLDAGAAGHFTKGNAAAGLVDAIRIATAERPCFGADVWFPIAAPAVDQTTAAPAGASALGARELQVLRLIGEDVAAAEIARALSMDPTLVEVYRRNIMRKLRLQDDAALREYARGSSIMRDGGGTSRSGEPGTSR